MDDQMIKILAAKLGISSKQAFLKAEEIKRLIEVRAKTSALNITGTADAVICLDLATEFLNLPFKKDLAVRLSGMRKKHYMNAVQTYAKFVGCSDSSTVSVDDIAQQLGCPQAAETAQSLLSRYKEATNMKLAIAGSEGFNFASTKFVAAAVYVTAKKMKIKIGKKRLIEVGKVGQVIFDKLCADMDKYFIDLPDKKSNQKTSKGSKSFVDSVQDAIEDVSMPIKRKRNSDDEDEVGYNYQEWKKRILSEDA